MITNLYSVRDTKVGFMAPFADANDAVAMRSFASLVANDKTAYHYYPADFSLYFVGQFESDSGALLIYDRRLVCEAVDVLDKAVL